MWGYDCRYVQAPTLDRRGELDLESAFALLLSYGLHQGLWLQNCRYSNIVMGFCMSARLAHNRGRMPSTGYATGNPGQGTYTCVDRLFWLVYIIYIQV